MFLSVFDMFKIGIGPSSSHTMGPMLAAARFLERLRDIEPRPGTRLKATLYGSLAYTGIGHDTIDAVLTLNPDVGIAARDAIAAAGTSQILGTFDLSPDVLQALLDGEMVFAIDQQQYLQGYLPIVFLVLYNQNANTVGGGLPVLTGPGFVDASNAAAVIDLAAGGTR